MRSHSAPAILGIVMILGICALTATPALAQTAPLDQRVVNVRIDSGEVRATNARGEAEVVFSEEIHLTDATWLRLRFDDVTLAGNVGSGSESYLLVTSLLDGHQQYLNKIHLRQWRYTSAYFNGDTIRVDLVATPGTGINRLRMSEVVTGVPTWPVTRSICGPTDDRQLSNDQRQGRLQPGGCTAWMIDDCNHCFLTAGHCTDSNDVVEFNVPLSDTNGSLIHPGPEDQYAVDMESLQSNDGGSGQGDDWGYFGCHPNTNTGLTPGQAQWAWYILAMPPAVSDQHIRITGYGTVSSPVSQTWNQVQKTHIGPYVTFDGTLLGYQTDTTGGNSGSPVVVEEMNRAIGIHGHGGCNYGDMENNGTGINHGGLQDALANPQGVCIRRTGLQVTPGVGMESAGEPGGPFTPMSITFTLENIGEDAFDYTVAKEAPWLTIENGSGHLASHASAEVTVRLNDAAYLLNDGLHQDSIGFVNVTNHDGDTWRDVSLTIGGPRVIYDFPLDTDPGWPVDGEWAFGQPQGKGGLEHGYPDPTSGATGDNVYGVNLFGDYDNSAEAGPFHVVMGPLDLQNASGCVLKYQRWLNTDYQTWGFATIEVANNPFTWYEVWSNGHNHQTDSEWVLHEVDISAYADRKSAVYIRWGYRLGLGAHAYSGWNIDDIQIWALSPIPPCRGDSNCDGHVNWRDIDFLVAAMNDNYTTWRDMFLPDTPPCVYWTNDVNDDGHVSWRDIDPFVEQINSVCP